MLGIHDLPLFIASGLLLNITPGADSLYIVTRSVTQGVRAGIAAVLGISTGCYVHIVAASLGLSALLSTSASVFMLVKLVGAAYLVYVGISLLRQRPSTVPDSLMPVSTLPLRKIFAQGFLTNVLNPKVALFFLAFVPQFIDPAAPSKALAFLVLGVIFNVNGTLWCLFLAWSAARIGSHGMGRKATAWLSKGTGALFVALGLHLALEKPQ